MRASLFEILVKTPVFFQRWEDNVYHYKIASAIISVILLIAVIYLLYLIRRDIKKSLEMIVKSVDVPELPTKRVVQQWEGIIRNLESDDESDYKLAVIEADNILDSLLIRMGYQGEDMGERLKQITPSHVANIQEVWAAHKLRNRIVHEPGFHLTRENAINAVEAYERAFEDLELL